MDTTPELCSLVGDDLVPIHLPADDKQWVLYAGGKAQQLLDTPPNRWTRNERLWIQNNIPEGIAGAEAALRYFVKRKIILEVTERITS